RITIKMLAPTIASEPMTPPMIRNSAKAGIGLVAVGFFLGRRSEACPAARAFARDGSESVGVVFGVEGGSLEEAGAAHADDGPAGANEAWHLEQRTSALPGFSVASWTAPQLGQTIDMVMRLQLHTVDNSRCPPHAVPPAENNARLSSLW